MELLKFRERHPGQYLVLQLGNKAMAESRSPSGIIEVFRPYEHLVDAVLFDPSGGTGRPFDPKAAAEFLRSFRNRYESFGFGVAGGLGPKLGDMESIPPLLAEFPGLSWDVEGKVRTAMPEDRLLIRVTREYIGQSFPMVKE